MAKPENAAVPLSWVGRSHPGPLPRSRQGLPPAGGDSGRRGCWVSCGPWLQSPGSPGYSLGQGRMPSRRALQRMGTSLLLQVASEREPRLAAGKGRPVQLPCPRAGSSSKGQESSFGPESLGRGRGGRGREGILPQPKAGRSGGGFGAPSLPLKSLASLRDSIRGSPTPCPLPQAPSALGGWGERSGWWTHYICRAPPRWPQATASICPPVRPSIHPAVSRPQMHRGERRAQLHQLHAPCDCGVGDVLTLLLQLLILVICKASH